MLIRGVLSIMIAIIAISAIEKDAICDWLEDQFGDKENKEDK